MYEIQTKSKYAYDHVKQNILQGDYPPGSRIVIRDISRALGISDTPIREALSRLESEGLLENTPQIGFTVSSLPHSEKLRELLQIRAWLELLMFQEISGRLSGETQDRGHALLDEMDKAAEIHNNYYVYGKLNDFYRMLYNCLSNRSLDDMLNSLLDKTLLAGQILVLVPGWQERMLRIHRRTFDLLIEGKTDEACKLYAKHKTECRDSIDEISKADAKE